MGGLGNGLGVRGWFQGRCLGVLGVVGALKSFVGFGGVVRGRLLAGGHDVGGWVSFSITDPREPVRTIV